MPTTRASDLPGRLVVRMALVKTATRAPRAGLKTGRVQSGLPVGTHRRVAPLAMMNGRPCPVVTMGCMENRGPAPGNLIDRVAKTIVLVVTIARNARSVRRVTIAPSAKNVPRATIARNAKGDPITGPNARVAPSTIGSGLRTVSAVTTATVVTTMTARMTARSGSVGGMKCWRLCAPEPRSSRF